MFSSNQPPKWLSTLNPLLSSPVLSTANITISNAPTPPLSSPALYPIKPIFNFTYRNCLRYRATPVQKYVYPDPIPEFAEFETQKFKEELLKKLSEEKQTFGKDLDSVVEVCAKKLGEFLHVEYGGPGTLLIEPFTDMLVALKKQKLPGASLAARTSLLWAQNHLDLDWEIWNSKS